MTIFQDFSYESTLFSLYLSLFLIIFVQIFEDPEKVGQKAKEKCKIAPIFLSTILKKGDYVAGDRYCLFMVLCSNHETLSLF